MSLSSAMAPSRSKQQRSNSNKMELVSNSSGSREQPVQLTRFQPQQQQPSQQQGFHRFGGPDTRASYSERRLMQHGSGLRTSHNHPSSAGHWQQPEKQMAGPGRPFHNSGAIASLSRSNGSLASAEQQNHVKDSNGNTNHGKPRSKTQTPGNDGHISSPMGSNGSGRKPRRGDFGGSHGSLDALASGTERENFFALLRDLGAQSSSGSSCGGGTGGTGSANGNGSLVPSRSSPDRDLDGELDPVHAKPIGCAPSRLAELLKPNFTSSARLPSELQPSGSFTLAQHQSAAGRHSTPEPPLVGINSSSNTVNKSATLPLDTTGSTSNHNSSSPKPKSKFQKFWDRGDRSSKDPYHNSHKSSNVPASTAAIATAITAQTGLTSSSTSNRSGSEPSIFKRIRGSNAGSKVNGANSSPEPQDPSALERDASEMEARLDERLKRKAFSHHDCQSMSVNLGYAARLRGLLSQRRNTTTGASAASMASASSAASSNNSISGTSSTGSLGKNKPSKSSGSSQVPANLTSSEADGAPEVPVEETDAGDGKSNALLLDCPFFRNELGGEPEWCVGVSRSSSPQLGPQPHPPAALLHRPVGTYGVSVLEFPPGKTHWKHGICPYQKQPSVLERGDQGAFYYGNHFYGQDHQNWFGMDTNLGPIAISIRREKINNNDNEGSNVTTGSSNHHHQQQHKDQFLYRIIIRTSELATLRGSVLEEAIPSLKPPGPKGLSLREVLDMVSPEIQLPCLRLAIPGQTTEQQLLKLDQQGLSNHYKVGILYCKAGQSTEEEMYNNEDGGPAFDEFLELIGQKVRLRGFEKYKAGLDNKMDSTGLYSVYAQHQGCEVMFHVSSLLPFTPNNRQQLLRKRHIGNDIVTVVFQEPGALPFTPRNIRSQFQHVFIVIRALHPCTEHTQYQVAVSRSKEVPVFGPPIPAGATFPKSKAFAEFLLAKIVNAEHAAHRSQKFSTMATRTRQEYLKDLATNYVTTSTLDSGSKFPILTFSSRKKERLKPKFFPDSVQAGAICWQVSVDDFSGGGGSVRHTDSLLGISADSLVLIEESTKECIWAVSCKAILGWTSSTSSIKLYYHQGECITVQGRDCEADEIPEIVARLHAVTTGCGTRELSLRRNAVGQLGFHVQPDGLVTEVEPHGPAWQASLRQGFRLVEICKVTVATLNHEQMVDLLKTSAIVTVTVLPPVDHNTPRRGCTLQSCSYIVGSIDGEYDNVHGSGDSGLDQSSALATSTTTRSGAVQQQSASVHSRRLRYERSVSPPRSSSSSGYGTGSSSRSFVLPASSLAATKERLPTNPEGTLTSTSSGHSSDDPWYDFMPDVGENELLITTSGNTTSPPPLPSRQGPPLGSSSHHQNQRMRPGHSCEIFSTPPAISVLQQSASIENIKSSGHGYSPLPHNSPVKRQNTTGPPTNGSNYSTPPSKAKPVLESPSLVGRMNNYEDLRRLQGGGAPPMMNSGAQDTPSNKIARPLNPPDYHHAMQSRLVALKSPEGQSPHGTGSGLSTASFNRKSPSSYASRSEDELSAGSGNSLSPRSRRRHNNPTNSSAGTLTPSSGSSRNQSPRLLVEAKLKSSAGPNGGHSSPSIQQQQQQKRGSTNLQEELLRLISPDADDVTSDAVIVTHARPVAVQSSPDVTAVPCTLPDDAEEMDWSRLVHAAARAIQGTVGGPPMPEELMRGEGRVLEEVGDEEDPTRDGSDNQDSLTSWIDDVTEKLRLEAEAADAQCQEMARPPLNPDDVVQLRMNQLEQTVGSLENRLRSEEDRRQSLEAEIRRLRDANTRLQGESQTAAQQLKRFTDWFFQTIEKP